MGSIIWPVSTVSLTLLFFYYLRKPEKFEKLIALLSKYGRNIFKFAEYRYVKYDIQGTINDYIARANRKTPHMPKVKADIKWVDKNQTQDAFINDEKIVIRMQKSDNQNKNLINATMAFVSKGFLQRAKHYVSKTQRESIDLFVCYDILKNERSDILEQFVTDYLQKGFENDKTSGFFEQYFNINNAGLFYPVFVQELTFIGSKAISKKKDTQHIIEEVKKLIAFLVSFAKREIGQDTVSEYNGLYSKFAIRIVGKAFKVKKEGERVYVNNIKKVAPDVETLYLIGARDNVKFIRSVFNKCKDEIDYSCIHQRPFVAILRKEEQEVKADSFIMVCRNNKIKVYEP